MKQVIFIVLGSIYLKNNLMSKIYITPEKLCILMNEEAKQQCELDKFKIGYEEPYANDANGYSHVIDENEEDEVSSDEVSLKSFKKQSKLNPKIWPNGSLNSKVRLRLMDIADSFWESLKINWTEPIDFIMTGSICNYNWSRFSDIDLHIIVNFEKVDEKTDFVKEFFDTKKNEFNSAHEDLKIYGFPIELYVQDKSEENISTGMYSLYKNKWIKEPDSSNIKPLGLNKYEIKEKSAYFMTCIDNIADNFKNCKDDAKLRRMLKASKGLKSRIKGLRKHGLEEDGEMSSGNIIFKCLRRSGHMGKLLHLIVSLQDRLDSL